MTPECDALEALHTEVGSALHTGDIHFLLQSASLHLRRIADDILRSGRDPSEASVCGPDLTTEALRITVVRDLLTAMHSAVELARERSSSRWLPPAEQQFFWRSFFLETEDIPFTTALPDENLDSTLANLLIALLEVSGDISVETHVEMIFADLMTRMDCREGFLPLTEAVKDFSFRIRGRLPLELGSKIAAGTRVYHSQETISDFRATAGDLRFLERSLVFPSLEDGAMNP